MGVPSALVSQPTSTKGDFVVKEFLRKDFRIFSVGNIIIGGVGVPVPGFSFFDAAHHMGVCWAGAGSTGHPSGPITALEKRAVRGELIGFLLRNDHLGFLLFFCLTK
jgi:hypothetical protein